MLFVTLRTEVNLIIPALKLHTKIYIYHYTFITYHSSQGHRNDMLFALRYTIRNKALFKSLSLQCGRKLENRRCENKPTARREFPGPELNQQKRKLNPCVAKRGFSLCRFSQFYYFQFSFYFIHVLFVRTHVRPFLRALTSDHDQAGKSRVIN